MRDIVVSAVDALWLKGVPETPPKVSFRSSLKFCRNPVLPLDGDHLSVLTSRFSLRSVGSAHSVFLLIEHQL